MSSFYNHEAKIDSIADMSPLREHKGTRVGGGTGGTWDHGSLTYNSLTSALKEPLLQKEWETK
jgi:hypothetical protein